MLGDPALRAVSQPVEDLEEARRVMADLRDTLHEFRRSHGFGRGISAVQIGAPIRVVYIEFDGGIFELVNPEYAWVSRETFQLWDDCFSFPGLLVRVERYETVAVDYQDTSGNTHQIEAEGSLAELLQHELDHLDGVLAVDRALDKDALCVREEWERQYRNAGPNPSSD